MLARPRDRARRAAPCPDQRPPPALGRGRRRPRGANGRQRLRARLARLRHKQFVQDKQSEVQVHG